MAGGGLNEHMCLTLLPRQAKLCGPMHVCWLVLQSVGALYQGLHASKASGPKGAQSRVCAECVRHGGDLEGCTHAGCVLLLHGMCFLGIAFIVQQQGQLLLLLVVASCGMLCMLTAQSVQPSC